MKWLSQISSVQQIFPAALKLVSVLVLMQIFIQNKTATFMDFLQSVKMTDKHWEH